MAKFPTIEELSKEVAERALDDFEFEGKTIREWADLVLSGELVPVVRCKDCDVPHNKWLGCPNLNGMIPPPDFYCAKGERRSGDAHSIK